MFKYFSRNGELLPIEQATVPLSNLEYSYGFGVYETIRVTAGQPQFLAEHLRRLQVSAQTIGLEHRFTDDFIADAIIRLTETARTDNYNLKLLLIGAPEPEAAQLYMVCLNPMYPDRRLYRDGTRLITYALERQWPGAKTLNMLPSYLAYREARRAGVYDALLVDRAGQITEGTRTNFLLMKGKALVSPPEDRILPGIMRKVVLKVAADNGFKLNIAPVAASRLPEFDGAFVTSTSSKILPVIRIDGYDFGPVSAELRRLMRLTDEFLQTSGGRL